MAKRDLPEPKAPGSAHVDAVRTGSAPSDNDNPAGGTTYEGVRVGPMPAGGIKAH